MMKKILYSLLTLFAVFSVASCTQEPLDCADPAQGGKPVTVTFSVGLRPMLTKADVPVTTEMDNGAGEYQLYVAAFSTKDGTLISTSKIGGTGYDPVASIKDGKAEVSLVLNTGQDYKVVFFAQKEGAYDVAFASGNVATFSFKDGVKANSADLDAFCATVDVLGTTLSYSVTLKRPFAQINVIVPGDNLPVGQTAFKSTMKVKAPKTYDLFGGKATGDAAEIVFAENAIAVPAFGKYAGETPYKWIGMNYVLVPASGNVEVTHFFESGMERVAVPGSIPVKVNCRTNLVGRVYSYNTDFNFNIQVDPIFDGEQEPGDDQPSGGDENPPSGGDETADTVTIPYEEAFTTGIGKFTTDGAKAGTTDVAVWTQDDTYGMKATAYIEKVNYAAESWLTSPLIDLGSASSPALSFEHATNFFTDVATAAKEATVWIKAEGGEWTQLTVTYPTSLSWNYVSSGEVDLGAYKGKKVQLGFKYTSTADKAGTWEVKNFKVAEAESTPAPTPDPDPDPQPTPTGNTVSLTNAEIVAALSAGTTTANSYADVTIASASGTWKGNMNAKNDLTFIQIRNNKNAHLTSPVFTSNISKIELTVNGGTGDKVQARNFYAIAANTDLSQFGSDNYNANANKEKWEAVTKYGDGSSTASDTNVEQTVTIEFTGDTKDFMLVAHNGAAYITSVTVYLK